jgi:tetratricopeptide repeat protein
MFYCRVISATVFLCMVGSFVSAADRDTSVEDIVAHHIEALGGRANIDKVKSTVVHAEYREGNFVMPGAYMAKMLPYYRTICDPNQPPGDVCEGYDGSAWEYYKEPGVVLRTVTAAAAAARHGLDLFDSLVDYKMHGTKVELIGAEMFHGKAAFKLHVTLADGFEKEMFVDKDSFLVVGDRRAAPVHAFGEAVRSENEIGDYRRVEAVMFPFLYKEVEIVSGREMNRLTIQSMEVNSKFTAASFAPPQFVRSPFQQFLENLYVQRTDPISVMWTYREFRAAHPDVDTRDGVEFIGYQMAKMKDFNGAVALLTANAADYPKSASAQYGLGRAYKAAGDADHARAAFRRALELDPGFKKASEGLQALR